VKRTRAARCASGNNNSRNADGSVVDVSKHVPWSRQLDKVRDAKLVADYSRPSFVLAGWEPKLRGSEYGYNTNEARRLQYLEQSDRMPRLTLLRLRQVTSTKGKIKWEKSSVEYMATLACLWSARTFAPQYLLVHPLASIRNGSVMSVIRPCPSCAAVSVLIVSMLQGYHRQALCAILMRTMKCWNGYSRP